MSTRRPTPEQVAAVDAFSRGDHLVPQAGTGTGKTTTLTLLGSSARQRRGCYLAFNKAIATEASSKFESNVACSTAHSLAFKAVGIRYRERLNQPRMSTVKLASMTKRGAPAARHIWPSHH